MLKMSQCGRHCPEPILCPWVPVRNCARCCPQPQDAGEFLLPPSSKSWLKADTIQKQAGDSSAESGGLDSIPSTGAAAAAATTTTHSLPVMVPQRGWSSGPGGYLVGGVREAAPRMLRQSWARVNVHAVTSAADNCGWKRRALGRPPAPREQWPRAGRGDSTNPLFLTLVPVCSRRLRHLLGALWRAWTCPQTALLGYKPHTQSQTLGQGTQAWQLLMAVMLCTSRGAHNPFFVLFVPTQKVGGRQACPCLRGLKQCLGPVPRG